MNENGHIGKIKDAYVDQKIVIALERISQALRILAWKAGTALHLNPIQLQILIFLLQHEHVSSKITSLAKEFNISKASISDSVNSLEHKNLIQKSYARGDVRKFNIQLTANGRKIAEDAALYAQDLSLTVARLPVDDKDKLFSILGEIIFDLHTSGVIPVQRMCRTCKYFETNGERHYCGLLNKELNTDQLQIDCSDHEAGMHQLTVGY